MTEFEKEKTTFQELMHQENEVRYLDNFYSINECCEVIGCSRPRLMQIIKDYKLSNVCMKCGEVKKILILKSDVKNLIDTIQNSLKKG